MKENIKDSIFAWIIALIVIILLFILFPSCNEAPRGPVHKWVAKERVTYRQTDYMIIECLTDHTRIRVFQGCSSCLKSEPTQYIVGDTITYQHEEAVVHLEDPNP